MKVQISIRGRSYTVRSDQDEDLPAIAAYVDARMADIAGRGTADDYTVALLTALNIASEFERFRRQVEADLAAVERDVSAAAVLVGGDA
jgi:cell division protein ZapA (FtsZ GTPase activity inhibitor)